MMVIEYEGFAFDSLFSLMKKFNDEDDDMVTYLDKITLKRN